MEWSDLNQEQRSDLTAWFLLADAEPPSKRENLPLEYSAAIAELASAAGKNPRTRFGKRQGTVVISNRRRIVRRRKAVGQLA